MEIISIDGAARLFPLMDSSTSSRAVQPARGHVDPAGVTSLREAARNLGAEVYRFTRVTDRKPRPEAPGTYHRQGNLVPSTSSTPPAWAREVGRFVGLELPILAMEISIWSPERSGGRRVAKGSAAPIDFEGEIYMRQEARAF